MNNARAVIDTNVIVSALIKRNSNPATIVKYIVQGKIIPVLNDEIITEYIDVLHRPKFNFNNNDIDTLLAYLTQSALIIKGNPIFIDLVDESDRVFYETAVASKALLITGNKKHYPNESFIMLPTQALKILR